jgi:membrane fusion protein (multidrug efflux system)
MEAKVDVSKQDGKTLADAPRGAATSQTQVFESQDDGADAEVRRVIAPTARAPRPPPRRARRAARPPRMPRRRPARRLR